MQGIPTAGGKVKRGLKWTSGHTDQQLLVKRDHSGSIILQKFHISFARRSCGCTGKSSRGKECAGGVEGAPAAGAAALRRPARPPAVSHERSRPTAPLQAPAGHWPAAAAQVKAGEGAHTAATCRMARGERRAANNPDVQEEGMSNESPFAHLTRTAAAVATRAPRGSSSSA
jgi:hypothetical protein